MKRRLLLLLALLPLAACGSTRRHEATRVVMGTKARIIYYAKRKGPGRKALDRIAALEAILSDYRKESEVMRLCARAGGDPVRVSEDLFTVLTHARRFSRESYGAFDVTVGALTHAMRDGRTPGAEELALVGWRKLLLDERTARLTKRGMILDLGGIGKGYAADEALKTLRKLGVTSALVDIGGDIAVGEPPPGEEGWRVEVNGRIRLMSNQAVAGSGGAHILDPRTGKPARDGRRVTVVAPKCVTADAWASAICVGARAPYGLEVYFAERARRKPTNSPSASHQIERGR